jgi:hypothetical protein
MDISRNDAVGFEHDVASGRLSRVARTDCSRGFLTHGIPANRFRRVATFELLNSQVETREAAPRLPSNVATRRALWDMDDRP